VDGPIATLAETTELPTGQIGELLVCGPVVTAEYVNRPHSNELGKILDGPRIWHRMGDVGYLDAADRFWCCGRLSQRVVTAQGTLFTGSCEAVFDTHPHVCRSALVGLGPGGKQKPVIIVEPWPEHRPRDARAKASLFAELREIGKAHSETACIEDFLWHPSLPVDIRHNAKIFREKLAVWAAERVKV
jgi:acyl-CoA synthetase (AMP-forming)/AMP-acid ligase II